MSQKCDVLVIGAGPAGSSAARSAVLNGAKTIFIDKKHEIGTPVYCAEGIGEYLFPYLPFKIPNKQLIWNIDGMFFWADDISIERKGSPWNGFSVDRKEFDKWLSELAIQNGAELWNRTELLDIELDEEDHVKRAIVNREGKQVEILPKVVVAADGTESTVLKLLGLFNPKQGDLADVYSWEMKNLDLVKPHFEQIYSGPFTPGGYGYIFPKSKNKANVGVGGIFPQQKMERYFEEFTELDIVKKQLRNAEFVIEKSKKAICNDLIDKWIFRNIILTGDAANQNLKPFIEGILPSIICGDIAGEISTNLSGNDTVDNEQYFDTVRKKLNENFEISKQLQDMLPYLFSMSGNQKYLFFFAIVSDLLDVKSIEEIKDLNYQQLKSKISELIDET